MPFLADRVEVIKTQRYTYPENGIEFQFYFRGYHADPAQCTIMTGTDEPLAGNFEGAPVFE